MDKPTGILGVSRVNEPIRCMYPFETLQIARGVITLSAWNPTNPAKPIDALIFKVEDLEDIIVVELMADQKLRTKKTMVPPENSET